MRILVIAKRQYTGRDVIDDRFGRIYEIPYHLANDGHDIVGLTLSYRRRSNNILNDNVKWQSVNLLPMGLTRYWRVLNHLMTEHAPDLIWACADVIQISIGAYLKQRFGTRLVLDLNDNFEAYGLTKLPGMTYMLKRACRLADGLTLMSHSLEDYIRENYATDAQSIVAPSAINDRLFYPRDRDESRAALGLPANAKLIGTGGAVMSGRGIDAMFEAFELLKSEIPDLYLVYAGPRDKTPQSFSTERTIDLGILNQPQMPLLFSALDVGIVCNLDSAFGRYCFPQKLYEIVACGTPVVATGVGDVKVALKDVEHALFEPQDHRGLARCLREHLRGPRPPPAIPGQNWRSRADDVHAFFNQIIAANV
ncbi:MAG: glycosyltransferase family 4 protein [Pseudomonadota bacterium]